MGMYSLPDAKKITLSKEFLIYNPNSKASAVPACHFLLPGLSLVELAGLMATRMAQHQVFGSTNQKHPVIVRSVHI